MQADSAELRQATLPKVINLYRPSLRPKKDPFPVSSVLLAIVIAFGLIVAGVFYAQNIVKETKAERDKLSASYNSFSKQKEELEKQAQARKVSQSLLDKLTVLKEEFNGKQALTLHLETDIAQPKQRYSEVMQDIAKYKVDGLWLTQFSLKENQFVFEGYTSVAAAVPEWMQQLASSSFFSKREFSYVEIKEAEDPKKRGLLVFKIRSEAPEPELELP